MKTYVYSLFTCASHYFVALSRLLAGRRSATASLGAISAPAFSGQSCCRSSDIVWSTSLVKACLRRSSARGLSLRPARDKTRRTSSRRSRSGRTIQRAARTFVTVSLAARRRNVMFSCGSNPESSETLRHRGSPPLAIEPEASQERTAREEAHTVVETAILYLGLTAC